MTNATPASLGPPAASTSILLINLGRRARELVDDRLHEHGLAYHHLSALGHLRRRPGISYSELARRASVTVQSMQTTVAHLEERGLVDRGAGTSQGRRADLHVTEEGALVLGAAESSVRAVDDMLLSDLDPVEQQQLQVILMRLFGTPPSPS